MSNKDNFAPGFLAGAIVGGLLGGALGVFLSSRLAPETEETDSDSPPEIKAAKKKKRLGKETGEMARRSLEDKIAQMNEALDELRYQLSSVNGTYLEDEGSEAIAEEP
ncbi:MAG TPA: hypothetical protein IGS52_03040 [Oscillatoriaceae cyanobacterium M33_DOE_052]|uniref:Gas vesicle protein n=1 Tax=Planktothricoides sp. SpSt-374 TaxID=2282167 RepID=A0A7C4A0D9_9CYAN|nr:hypothetical protein [Oscillatoriaceae cyanobacterium M33_DOE_052]